jgi:hypothetical protein
VDLAFQQSICSIILTLKPDARCIFFDLVFKSKRYLHLDLKLGISSFIIDQDFLILDPRFSIFISKIAYPCGLLTAPICTTTELWSCGWQPALWRPGRVSYRFLACRDH